jgi:protease-4
MGNFLKQTFASVIGTLLGLFIFSSVGTIALFSLLLATTLSQDGGKEVKDKSVLVFDMSVKITDGQPSSNEVLQKALSGTEEDTITLRKVLETIEKAQQDPRIVAIYLDGTHPSETDIGFASLTEIRQALEKFRASGKKIVAYGMDWSKREYFLSSVANEIIVNPVGLLEVNGFSSQPMFLAGALQKYGIGVQVVRVGKFKGAVEPYILNKLSPANREQTQKLLDDVWAEWRTTVATSRKIIPQKLQEIADNQSILDPVEAKTNGLVDEVEYPDQLVAELKQLTDSNDQDQTFHQIDLTDYAQVPGKSVFGTQKSDNKIAVVYAEGEIVDGRGDDGQIGGDRFAAIFNKLRQDHHVKAVVLRINSPGGSASAAEVMEREIRLTRQLKPVVVSMGDVAASGGYWIASNANRIFAEPSTITGSIGVFGILFNGQKLANNNGITWDTVKTSRYADTQTISRPRSPTELAIYQHTVNRIYYLFLNKVSQGRKLPIRKVAEIAQGRVWSGEAAKEIGLVDDIGGLKVAIAYTAKQANLGDNWELQEYPQVSTWQERLFGQALEETRTKFGMEKAQVKPTDPLTGEFQQLQREVAVMQQMNDPQGVYARLPFNLKIK